MDVRGQRLKVIVTLCAAIAAFMVWTGPASAGISHTFMSSFGAFSGVQGVAVDQASGDVYVYDAAAGTVSKFTSAGASAEFSALKADVIEGVGSSGEGEGEIAVDSSAGPAKGDIYVANGSQVKIYGADGKSLGELTEEAPSPWGRPCGVAVDSAGNVYVGLAGEPGAVDKYTPAANPVANANYASSLWRLTNACNVAVDSSGSVYVNSLYEGPVTKYEGLQFSVVEAEPSGTVIASSGRAVAVDTGTDPVTKTTDTLFVDLYSEIAQYEPDGTLVGTFTAPEDAIEGIYPVGNYHGIAVSDTTGDVYQSDNYNARADILGPTVVIPDVTTSPATNVENTSATLNGIINTNDIALTECFFEYGTVAPGLPQFFGYVTYDHTIPCAGTPEPGPSPVAVTANLAGLEPNKVYGARLVASNANGSVTSKAVELFTLSPPLVTASVSKVGYSTATLQAEINPLNFATTYHFEYGPTESYGTSIPVPDASLAPIPPEGQQAWSVGDRLVNLQAGAIYHYRVVATSVRGTTESPDQTFTTFTPAQGGQTDTCPNAAIRDSGLSENLPDCRAYELVSPINKNDADIIGQDDTNLASASGNAVVFAAHNGFGDTHGSGGAGGNMYVAFRGASEWETHAVFPTPAPSAIQIFFGSTIDDLFSAELERSVVEGYSFPHAQGGLPEAVNLYLENNLTGALETISVPQGGAEVTSPFAILGAVRGGSADLGVVTWESSSNFVPQATGSGPKLYAMNHGTLELAGVLPGGSIPAGGSSSPRELEQSLQYRDTVSTDGSRLFFMSPSDGSSAPQLYMRESGSRTVWVSQSEASTPDPEPQNVKFQGATPDGSRVVFSTTDRLLDADPGGPGYAIYLYTNSPNPETEANLTFIGRFNGSGPEVLGMSEDAKRIYFTTGEEGQGGGGSTRLVIWDEGVSHEIANRYKGNAGEGDGMRVSTNGERAAFFSYGRGLLTGGSGEAERTEVYLYDAPSQTLRCVSCPANGASVVASVAVNPGATEFGVGLGYRFPHHFMSADGRYVLFSTPEALVPQDTNGLTDTYEYNAETGEVSLLSSGTGDHGAWFADASPSGHDVFFVTQQSYSRADTDDLVDLYDARVNGGLPEPPPSPVPCAGDACQGTPSAAPTFNTASGFEGLGNVGQKQGGAPKEKVGKKKKSRPKKHPVKKHKKKRHAAKRSKPSGERASRRSGR